MLNDCFYLCSNVLYLKNNKMILVFLGVWAEVQVSFVCFLSPFLGTCVGYRCVNISIYLDSSLLFTLLGQGCGGRFLGTFLRVEVSARTTIRLVYSYFTVCFSKRGP